jgi:hypothetical protein
MIRCGSSSNNLGCFKTPLIWASRVYRILSFIGQDDDVELTLLNKTTPFNLGYITMRIECGKLRMTQTKTAENFATVTLGIAISAPSIMFPRKPGEESWSKEVEYRKAAIVSALKHWKPR